MLGFGCRGSLFTSCWISGGGMGRLGHWDLGGLELRISDWGIGIDELNSANILISMNTKSDQLLNQLHLSPPRRPR